jgi:hypothetical protein
VRSSIIEPFDKKDNVPRRRTSRQQIHCPRNVRTADLP